VTGPQNHAANPQSAIRDPQFNYALPSPVCAVSECVAAKQNRQLREMAGETIANMRSREAKVDRHP
jgi:hypothetical protein